MLKTNGDAVIPDAANQAICSESLETIAFTINPTEQTTPKKNARKNTPKIEKSHTGLVSDRFVKSNPIKEIQISK